MFLKVNAMLFFGNNNRALQFMEFIPMGLKLEVKLREKNHSNQISEKIP